ncbi:SDR family oxidoreductase [Cocleimonas flava]|uniref:NAD(P)-dependent dehydrogenase (Short-subunit alcohol dehydrogenase family) n=1 Tax=Cocleimonas flava TaxID=634765 RepID=A0A4R1EU04_9GAMM|nr:MULTISPECIES: SDR family oxidoreductase [Cocleimonas]MEB8433496.1 SDR family oxidoreductase [Cocleimonas sp. KMM 6892]MEC4716307.1 SDR family oxidoreductase [Cocleimonas sp. KMM 6895]MEC4745800.1 SDR family oxidoreductase [Cocleimonas sp. KMM 6896]TCJ85137.1 NAD(P)-dependent dehydrogenase (short-subunit alcohol dehydrogenase family) [Cocleimonas flava]
MNKVALITGSSRGIGAATAIRLAKDGYDICVNYHNDEASANLVVDEVRKHGRLAIAVKADVSIEADVAHLFDIIDLEFGTLHTLINNAGILMQQCRVEELDADRINKILTTNVTSYFICSREAIKRMSPKHGGQGGTIVNVSSAAARLGSGGEYVDYAASKGAIDSLTLGLATELAEENIRVNGVRPGVIYTDIHSDGGEPDRVDRIKKHIPLKRGGKAEEVAAAIAWLVSDESSYTTGTFIEVTGGR